MSTKVDKIVKSYRTFSQIPAVVGAQIISQNIINTVWSRRNLEKGKSTKFSKFLFLNNGKIDETLPVDVSSEVLSTISKSRKYRAVLRENDTKQFLEIWRKNNLYRCVDLAALDVHGNVYSDGELASFEFSPDEKKLLYIAEKKSPKTEPFYKRKKSDEEANKGENGDSPKPTKGGEYVYQQDWGEQMVGKKQTVLAEYHIELDTIELVKGLPDNVCAGQCKYSPDGGYIIGVAYFVEPRKLGIVYCGRPSTIFRLDFSENYLELPLKDRAVKAPTFTVDGSSILWLDRDASGPHATNMKLVLAKVPLSTQTQIKTIVDTVPSKLKIKNDRDFFGLYNQGFIKHCWASQNRLLINTQQKNTVNSYVISIDDGTITELESSPDLSYSQFILDCQDDTLLAVRRNFLVQDRVFWGKLPGAGSENNIEWVEICPSEKVPEIEGMTYKYLHLKAKEEDSVRDFNAIYIGPLEGKDKKTPLVVWPHGGPHAAFANYMFLECNMLLSLGYAVLLVNYRGSLGSGEDSVNFLPGKVGDADVQDCIQATDEALKQFSCLNPDAVVLNGGSHGGFLVTHLSGQHPDKYKAVVARNPVIDIASMSVQSDIPDWCYVESGSTQAYTQKGPLDNDLFIKMRQMSPIIHAHKVKAPTLLQIGSKDLRVPPSQGNEYYLRLKANGVTTKMLLYDDNHPIASVNNEIDDMINALLWFEEHLGRNT